MAFKANDILECLDKGSNSYSFPMFDNNYFYFGKEKLALFRNDEEWLMVFQELSFSIKAKKFANIVTAFGNCVEGNGIILIKEIVSESSDAKMFDNNRFLLNLFHFKVAVKGKEKVFIPSKDDYQKIGIDVDDDKMPNEAKIIRYLAYTISDDLYFTNDELLEICRRKDSNLNLFMEIEDWHHPDLINDELPSENLCFQSIAKALEENDKNLYNCPKEEYNTHWSNWEWYKEEYS